MKIDFYDLFSLHTPKDFPDTGEDNYITAAVKSRVMENIPVSKSKPVRINRIGRAVIAAAAAVVVLAMGTLAASALGLIDLEKVFGGIFDSGHEHLEDISALPQNVVTTGDDRLSLRVLGICGTENEAVISIEAKRNDGGKFPENFFSNGLISFVFGEDCETERRPPKLIDEKTAVYTLRVHTDHGESIVGKEFKLEFNDITDIKPTAIVGDKLEYKENDSISENSWSISFPLEYKADYITITVNQPMYVRDPYPFIPEIGYSSISLDIFFGSNPYDGAYVPHNISITLDNGEEVQIGGGSSERAEKGEKPSAHYSFISPVDIDSIETITIGDIVIPVK